jgi:hypothetical protein
MPEAAPGARDADLAAPDSLPLAAPDSPPPAAADSLPPDAPDATSAAAPATPPDVVVPIGAPVPLPASDTTAVHLAPPPMTDMSNISRDELDVLLARGAALTPGEVLAAGAPVPLPVPATGAPEASLATPAQTEQDLSEAESVLAEELAKLLAETAPPEALPPARAAVVPAAPAQHDAAEGLRPDELAGLMESPAAAAAPVVEAPAPAVAPPPAAEAPPAAPVAAPAVAEPPAAAEPAPATIAEPPASTPAASSAPSAPLRRGLLQRLQSFISDLVLMVAQILDIPFGRMDDQSRAVIGMTAFLLLLGGAVLWFMACFTNQSGS